MLAIISALFLLFYMLQSESSLLTHYQPLIAGSQFDLLKINIIFMTVIVIPTLILLFFVSWKHHAKNLKAQYEPASFGAFGELILWMIPLIIIIVLAIITWGIIHNWQPSGPLESEPFTVQSIER
jgi:cytochrome o ubiquinol oxidase subunit 2